MTSDSLNLQTSHPINNQTVFAALRDALAELYPAEQDAHVIVDDVGLVATQIAFNSRAPNQLA